MKAKMYKSDHRLSHQDELLVAAIENHHLQLPEFSHEVHVKLAYCYLAGFGFEPALKKTQDTLLSFLQFHGVDPKKFHLTLTQAWLKTVWHFMQKSSAMTSADDFVKANRSLLNKDLLASHYSDELLFSNRARKKFINPDLSPFPE